MTNPAKEHAKSEGADSAAIVRIIYDRARR
jgi:hypothetical protein